MSGASASTTIGAAAGDETGEHVIVVSSTGDSGAARFSTTTCSGVAETVKSLTGDMATFLGVIFARDRLFRGVAYGTAALAGDSVSAGASPSASAMGARLIRRLRRRGDRRRICLSSACLTTASSASASRSSVTSSNTIKGWASAIMGADVLGGSIGARLLCLFRGTYRRSSAGNVAGLDVSLVTCAIVRLASVTATVLYVRPLIALVSTPAEQACIPLASTRSHLPSFKSRTRWSQRASPQAGTCPPSLLRLRWPAPPARSSVAQMAYLRSSDVGPTRPTRFQILRSPSSEFVVKTATRCQGRGLGMAGGRKLAEVMGVLGEGGSLVFSVLNLGEKW